MAWPSLRVPRWCCVPSGCHLLCPGGHPAEALLWLHPEVWKQSGMAMPGPKPKPLTTRIPSGASPTPTGAPGSWQGQEVAARCSVHRGAVPVGGQPPASKVRSRSLLDAARPEAGREIPKCSHVRLVGNGRRRENKKRAWGQSPVTSVAGNVDFENLLSRA